MKKVIFGGNFDPIHLGHLNMARIARDTLGGEVIFVPAKIGVWKEDSISEEHKLEMLKLAIANEKGFSISTFELDQEKQPYSIDTVRYFKKKYPKAELYLLVGQDQANSFHLWKEPEEIRKLANVVFVHRPKVEINQENVERFKMQCLDGGMVEVSSSDIRNMKSVAMPESVLKYIEDNDLYFIKKVKSYMKETRYLHSLSVAHVAYKIAKIHGLNYEKAYIAGMLHDTAKYIANDESLTLMKKLYPEYLDIGLYAYHQFLGEMIAKNDFGVTDEDILNAIKYHTTGRKEMGWLEKLIYAADKIEPTRKYDSSDLVKAMEEDFNSGFLTVLKANKEFLLAKNKTLDNRLSEECFSYYLG